MLCYVMLCDVMLCYVMLCMYVCMYVCMYAWARTRPTPKRVGPGALHTLVAQPDPPKIYVCMYACMYVDVDVT